MPTQNTSSWISEAIFDLQRLVDESGPALRRRLEPAVARIAAMNGANGLRDALLRSSSTPFVRLIDAAALDLGLRADPRVGLLGRSTVLAYLYVRLQDDLVDEEALVDRASVFAMEAVLCAHLRLLAEAGTPASGWIARSRVMQTFAEVAAVEADEREGHEPLARERCGDKWLAMAIPLLAMASLVEREDLHETLTEYVRCVGAALQMVNDVLNAPEDHLSGRRSPLLRELGLGEGLDHDRVRAIVMRHPVTEQALEHGREQAWAAVALASARGLEQLAALAEAVAGKLDDTRHRLLAQMLGVAI